MNRVRWERHREEIERQIQSGGLIPREDHRPKPGDYLGTLRFYEAGGKVRSWTIRQGPRQNQIQIDGAAKPHGWAWFFGKLRERLSILTRWA